MNVNLRTAAVLTTFFCLFAFSCPAQEKELKELAASLTTQIKQRGKGPVAITSFVSGKTFCPAFSSYVVDRLTLIFGRQHRFRCRHTRSR